MISLITNEPRENLSLGFPTMSDTNRAVQPEMLARGLKSRGIVLHYENMPMQYTAIFHGRKNDNFQMKNCDSFLIFAQNIYRLWVHVSNEYPQSMF